MSMPYVEGTTIAPEIERLLDRSSVPPLAVPTAGTIYPASAKFHMPLRKDNMLQLQALAQRHPFPEVCDHIVVYEGDTVLLDAYDAGDGEVHVNRSALSSDRIARIREILGVRADN